MAGKLVDKSGSTIATTKDKVEVVSSHGSISGTVEVIYTSGVPFTFEGGEIVETSTIGLEDDEAFPPGEYLLIKIR